MYFGNVINGNLRHLFLVTMTLIYVLFSYRNNYQPPIYDEYHQIMSQNAQQMLPNIANGHIVPGTMSPISMLNNEALSPSGTPTRGSKVGMRPSQPPPAPPSATNSSSR